MEHLSNATPVRVIQLLKESTMNKPKIIIRTNLWFLVKFNDKYDKAKNPSAVAAIVPF